ncbi:MAG: hypothetical protein J6Q15_00850, partial [Clostridia bacterium]|nr:hypothetical protein [Clostridia bacterium]
MKFFGKDIKEANKGYFGVRRCTICKDELRDVDLVELYAVSYFCFIPVRKTLIKRILVCKHCNSFMEINNDLWEYYSTYYNKRFNKPTTDGIIDILTTMSQQMEQRGVKLGIDNKCDQQS